jgi:hypothetical protein
MDTPPNCDPLPIIEQRSFANKLSAEILEGKSKKAPADNFCLFPFAFCLFPQCPESRRSFV